jgi:hypothetical protein
LPKNASTYLHFILAIERWELPSLGPDIMRGSVHR